MPNSDDEYIKKGTLCKCRSCGTIVEVTDPVGMIIEYRAINSTDIQQEVFAVFCIEFEVLDSEQ